MRWDTAQNRRRLRTGVGLTALLAGTVVWQHQRGEKASRLSSDVHALTVLPGGRLLTGQPAGVSVSSDRGRTWSAPDGAGDALTLAAAPGSPTVILAGHNVLKASQDAGATWRDATVGRLASRDLHGFAIVPNAPNVWYVNVAGLGLYRTRNARTWEVMSPETANAAALAAAPGATPRLYAVVGTRLIASDGGTTWAQLSAPPATGLGVHPLSGHVYLAGPSGLWRSTDRGATWTRLGFQGGARLVAIDPGNESSLYAVSEDGRLFSSLDRGRTWRPAGQSP